MKRVFISATSRDLGSFRKAVSDELLHNSRIRPVQQDHFSPTFQTLKEELTEKIRSCDAVICLVGKVYGEEPRSRPEREDRRSYTQMEYDIALKLRKPIYLFIAGDAVAVDESFDEDEEKAALQEAHREALIGGNHPYQLFQTEEALTQHVARIDFDRLPGTGRNPLVLLGGIALLLAVAGVIWIAANDDRNGPSPALNNPSKIGGAEGKMDKGDQLDPDQPVTLELKESYKEGENMELAITAHRSGYLYVGACWADNRVFLLYPNFHAPLNKENRVEANQRIHLPGDLPKAEDGRELTYPMYFPDGISGKVATETIFAFISPLPIELPDVEIDTDLGASFRELGIVEDRSLFRLRGPRPELSFKHTRLPLNGISIVSKEYRLEK